MSQLTQNEPPLCPHSPRMTPFMSLLSQDDPPLCPHSARMTPLYVLTLEFEKDRHIYTQTHNYMLVRFERDCI